MNNQYRFVATLATAFAAGAVFLFVFPRVFFLAAIIYVMVRGFHAIKKFYE
jgi:hypothetical protein